MKEFLEFHCHKVINLKFPHQSSLINQRKVIMSLKEDNSGKIKVLTCY